MRAQVICFLALACFPPLWSQPLNKLPDWAMPHVQAVAAEAAPDGADAWVLLDRTQVAYAGDGEIRTRRFRLVKVLSERGLGQGAFILGGLGDQASRVRELRGWNLRPDGDLEKLSKDATATWESGVGGGYSTDQQILAVLPRVTKGSLVAFESLQSFRHPLGPLDATEVLEVVPIRQWELEVVLDAAWFRSVEGVAVNLDLKHFAPWIPAPVVQPGRSVKASNLPALPRGESMHPHAFDQLPFVLVRFLDPRLKETPSLATWDSLAIWLNRQYQERCPRSEASGAVGKGPLEGLKAIHAWMGRDFLYKQVYLTPSRGWLPETAVEVVRKKYGDCKDLAGCFLAEAAGLGVQGSPVLARIGGGEIQPDLPPSLTHDHVVAALRLPQSLGLAAEVETPKGRYLLVDLTDPDTPLGQLGEAHRGRWLMICDPSGALWVRAPEAAILQPRIRVEVTGEVNLGGKLTATVRFVETGDKLDLRSAARGSGKLVDFIAREILDVPPTGSITLVSQSDPRDIHRPFEAVVKVVRVSSMEVAEAAKILENTYRAVNIAMVNELKMLYDKMGIDVWEVIDAAKTKPFGFQAFYPGPGLGGHCIPIDPFYLTWLARKWGEQTRFIELAGEINTHMPNYVVSQLAEFLNDAGKPIKGSKIAILGAAYKKDVDDPRESPSFELMKLLLKRGAVLSYNDPHVPILPKMRHYPGLPEMDSQPLTAEYLAAQDCVLISTDHTAYDMKFIVQHSRMVLDTRNATKNVTEGREKIFKA